MRKSNGSPSCMNQKCCVICRVIFSRTLPFSDFGMRYEPIKTSSSKPCHLHLLKTSFKDLRGFPQPKGNC